MFKTVDIFQVESDLCWTKQKSHFVHEDIIFALLYLKITLIAVVFKQLETSHQEISGNESLNWMAKEWLKIWKENIIFINHKIVSAKIIMTAIVIQPTINLWKGIPYGISRVLCGVAQCDLSQYSTSAALFCDSIAYLSPATPCSLLLKT